jgi:tyrosyl-tRNA synthetase
MNKKVDISPEKVDALLSRGVEDVLVADHLRQAILSGRQLRVKWGIDPTSKTIHIGRAIVLSKLREFQDLGHTIVFIVGDFTAQVGDPSDKLEKRPMLSEAEVKENLKNYKAIAGKILDMKKVEFFYNSRWLAKLTFKETCQLAETFSVQQMISRRNFAERIEKGQEVSLREFLYPLMQGYDSVMVKADVELGGTDQLFNLKAGRLIQKHYGQPEQDILMTAMLEGTDGRKMSSSWGNVINITDEPNDMYGKIMAVRDDLVIKYFTLCTRVPLSEIEALKQQLSAGANPRDVKMRLAREIVTLYHGKDASITAEKEFVETFSGGGVPENLETLTADPTRLLADVLVERGALPSKAQWRRLIDEGAILNVETKEKITDPFWKASPGVYRIGKKTFIRFQ